MNSLPAARIPQLEKFPQTSKLKRTKKSKNSPYKYNFWSFLSFWSKTSQNPLNFMQFSSEVYLNCENFLLFSAKFLPQNVKNSKILIFEINMKNLHVQRCFPRKIMKSPASMGGPLPGPPPPDKPFAWSTDSPQNLDPPDLVNACVQIFTLAFILQKVSRTSFNNILILES